MKWGCHGRLPPGPNRKRVTVLVNLAPRALRGVESEGMILMTNNAEGKLVFVNPGADGVENGALIS